MSELELQALIERLTADVLNQVLGQIRRPGLQLSILAFDMEIGASHSWKGDRREMAAALRVAADRLDELPPRTMGEG